MPGAEPMTSRASTLDHHRAAVADRLHLMFKRGVAYADDQRDIAFAIDTVAFTKAQLPAHTIYLYKLFTRVMNCPRRDEAIALSHEERIAVYVAAKAVAR